MESYEGGKPHEQELLPRYHGTLMDATDVVNAHPLELERMNRNKIGRPFRYTDSMFSWFLFLTGYMDLSYA